MVQTEAVLQNAVLHREATFMRQFIYHSQPTRSYILAIGLTASEGHIVA